ncbi:MAG: nuclear transport factor 2 family protein, partial [Bacteroidota bacterium]
FALNGRPSNAEIQEEPTKSQNPFASFIGEWTLKEDTWIQNWGGQNDTIKIPGHHTVSSKINTEHSLLSIVDGPEPNGHIFWTYNPNTREVGHLSSFGTIRLGKGSGQFYGDGNLRLKVSFEGEAKGTYRIYTYEWISPNEYALNSVQFDANDQPTGLFYKGNFLRIEPATIKQKAMDEVLAHGAMIRDAFAEGDLATISALHHPEVVKALGYQDEQKGRQAVMEGIRGTLAAFKLEFVENEVENIYFQGDLAIEQTRFAIKGTPKSGGDSFLFKGRTMVTYVRHANSPSGWATIREIIQPATD